MERRSFVAGLGGFAAGLLCAGGKVRSALAAPVAPLRTFEIVTEIDLAGRDGAAQLWVPLAQTAGGCQTALDLAFESSGRVKRTRDRRYGAEMLAVTWQPGAERTLRVAQRVATRDRGPEPMQGLTEADRRFWLQPTPSVPTDGIVRETADRIVAGKSGDREKLRAIYDWVVENTFRDGATRGCGTGDIANMLKTGWLGGKCADINSLMVGLARAAGIPARDVYGIRVGPSAYNKVLGAQGDITHAQHCRAEMWLDSAGWFPVDPADVRKLVLETKLPLGSDEVRASRERLFGSWEMNWVGYNSATDITLPDAPGKVAGNFLMYPCALTVHGQPDCLEPASFKYRITSQQVA